MDNLSTILKRLMSEKGINSAELARRTGITQPAVYRLMMGDTANPQVLTLAPIASYFCISIEQLIGLAPLGNRSTLNDSVLHSIETKLSTIKTVATVLCELLPRLIDGYQKAVSAQLVKEAVSSEILPLLIMNTSNLLESANQIQEILMTNKTV